MNEEINKKNILILLFLCFSIFNFIGKPLSKIIKVNEEIENIKNNLVISQKKEKIIFNDLEKEKKLLEDKNLKINYLNSKKIFFESLGEMNLYIESISRENNLDLFCLGRTKEEKNSTVIGYYKIKGEKKNIKKLINIIDNEKKLFFSEQLVEINIDKEVVEIDLYLYGFLNLKKNKHFFQKNKSQEINIEQVKMINDEAGIFIIDNKKYYIVSGDTLNIEGKEYKIFINKKIKIIEK